MFQDYLEKYNFNHGNSLGLINWQLKKEVGMLFHDETYLKGPVKTEVGLRTFVKPQLNDDMFIKLCLDILNQTEATKECVRTVLTVLFPYFNENLSEIDSILLEKDNPCEDAGILVKALNLQSENIFLLPCFKSRLLSLYKTSKTSFEGKRPDCSEFLLTTLALLILQRPSTVEEITVLLLLLFPGLAPHKKELKEMVKETVTEEKEFVIKEINGQVHYKINTIELRNSKRMLEEFVQNQHNFKGLQETFFEPKSFAGIFASIGVKL